MAEVSRKKSEVLVVKLNNDEIQAAVAKAMSKAAKVPVEPAQVTITILEGDLLEAEVTVTKERTPKAPKEKAAAAAKE